MHRHSLRLRGTVAAAAMMLCVSLAADAEEPANTSEAPQAIAEAKPDGEASPEFKPPPGFRTRKRGDVVLYCRKEAVLGSRFPAEKRYDQAGLLAMQCAELERTETLARMRACTTGSCSTN